MTFSSEVSGAVFAKLISGAVSIEPRLNDVAHRKIKIGDLILFINRTTKEERLAKVTGLLRFGSFTELFNAYPPERFGAENLDELKESMKRLYTPNEEVENGVIGIKIHVLKSSSGSSTGNPNKK